MTIKKAVLIPIGLSLFTAMGTVAALRWLDLSPHVEQDFFFSAKDPQFLESAAIERQFPSSSQFIIRATGRVGTMVYESEIRTLVNTIQTLDGVRSIRSILNTPALDDPLWKPLLVSPDETATYLLVEVDADEAGSLVNPLSAAIQTMEQRNFQLQISGVPYVIELIERFLFRDLMVFSIAAFVVFGIAIAVVYRRALIVTGTLLTCLASALITLTVLQLVGLSLGLLTANLVTIVFILTLSHIVFLTSNWRRDQSSGDQRVLSAIGTTRLASFWCMATTSLGFLSLLLASARPLRDLGVAGATGTLVAIVAAYAMYPWFLRLARPPDAIATGTTKSWLPTRYRLAWLGGLGLLTVGIGVGIGRLSTDPNLLSYFREDGAIRSGLEQIDHDGGSSPLRVVAEHEDGRPLDRGTGAALVLSTHDSLLSDVSVGSVVSPALLFAEIERSPLATDRSVEEVLDLPIVQPFVAPFFSRDRTRAHFMMRMRESGRQEPRQDIIDRLEGVFESDGLRPVQVGGLYQLQSQLAQLVASSLRIALSGLIVLFAIIGWVLSRSVRTVASMTACLVVIPLIVLGTFGHLGIAIDIISSPAANVALAMGVDSMIHLVVRVPRLHLDGTAWDDAWTLARNQLQHPIAGAGLIISTGFAIFALSTFPPTDRFGLAVVLGTATAVVMALIGLPFLATGGSIRIEGGRTR